MTDFTIDSQFNIIAELRTLFLTSSPAVMLLRCTSHELVFISVRKYQSNKADSKITRTSTHKITRTSLQVSIYKIIVFTTAKSHDWVLLGQILFTGCLSNLPMYILLSMPLHQVVAFSLSLLNKH